MKIEIKKVVNVVGNFVGLNVLIDDKRTKIQFSGCETSATKEDILCMIDYYNEYIDFYKSVLSLYEDD